MTQTRWTPLAALLMAALLLAGCGGGGGGEPTVTQTVHDELQAELDAALANLEKERKAKAGEEAARETAEGEVTRLTGELATATGNVTRLEGELGTATTNVGQLTAQLVTATGNVTRLEGELEAANGRVTDLTNRIGSADDAASDAESASLNAQLKAAKAEVTRLEDVIGTVTDAADAAGSLHAQLVAANAEVTRLTNLIGTEPDNDGMGGSGLRKGLADAQAEVTRLTDEIGTASDTDSLKGMLEAEKLKVRELEGDLRVAKNEIESLEGLLATARGETTTERERADDAEEREQQATRQAQGLEANQRANSLLRALQGTAYTGTSNDQAPPAFSDNMLPVTVNVPSRNTLRIEASTYTGGTRSVAGQAFRTARLTRTRGGIEETIVAYTDREVSRTLIDHYGDMRPSASSPQIDMEADGLPGDGAADSSVQIGAVTDVKGRTGARIVSHGFAATKRVSVEDGMPDDTDLLGPTASANMKSAPSYSGSVHGVPGTFRCSEADCDVTLAATYEATGGSGDTTFAYPLSLVTIGTDSDGTEVHFRPNSASALVYLGPSGVTGVVGDDTQYMTFGWWRTAPATSTGNYMFEVFADDNAAPAAAWSGTEAGTAEYDGPAVGVYVEHETVSGSTTAVRQGEFTAMAHLTAQLSGTQAISGSVDSFQTIPVGGGSATPKPWRVLLRPYTGAAEVMGNAEIAIPGTTSQGKWEATPLANHAYSRAVQPLAAVGRFDTRILQRLHLSGAFGVHRTRATGVTE